MDWVELVAAILGFAAVGLTVLRQPWCWPIGLAQVLLYLVVFSQRQLYSQALLQVLFAGLQVHGWVQWRRQSSRAADARHDEVEVSSLPADRLVLAIFTAVAIGLSLAWFMQTFTSAVMAYPDAMITGLSLVAQWLMIHRKLENWWIWIAVNLLTIYVCAMQGLWITLVLYVLFLFMAIGGAIAWYRRLVSLSANPENQGGVAHE